jgi:hypothetical protein
LGEQLYKRAARQVIEPEGAGSGFVISLFFLLPAFFTLGLSRRNRRTKIICFSNPLNRFAIELKRNLLDLTQFANKVESFRFNFYGFNLTAVP